MTVLSRAPGEVRTTTRQVPWWLLVSAPLAALAIGASLAGIFVDRVYASETANWETQAIGQDIANLVVFPLMLVFAYAAARGSLGASLAWLGTVVYAAYGYAIYVFDVHFGPLFLVYVAIFGLSFWALVGGLRDAVRAHVEAGSDVSGVQRFAAALLIGTAGAFALLWLAEDVPAVISGSASDTLTEAGVPTNPVHVLDLSIFLPAAALAGVQLRRGLRWGRVLAPILLVAMSAISVGIVALSVVAIVRDQDGSFVVTAVIGALGLVQAVTAWHLVRASRPRVAEGRANG